MSILTLRMKPFLNQPIIGLFIGVAAIGLAPIFARLSQVDSCSTAFWRLLLASILLLGHAFFTKRDELSKIPKAQRRLWFFLTVFAGFAFASDLWIWHNSIHRTSVANATLLANLAPFFMLVSLRFLFKERVATLAWCGIFIGLSGVVLLTRHSNNTNNHFDGDVMALQAAVFYSIYLLILKKCPPGVSSLTTLGVASLCGALLLFPFAVFRDAHFFPHDWHGILDLVLLALVSQVIGQGFIARNLPRVEAAPASAILCCQTLFAAFASWCLFRESLNPIQCLGGSVVLAGLFVVRLSQAK